MQAMIEHVTTAREKIVGPQRERDLIGIGVERDCRQRDGVDVGGEHRGGARLGRGDGREPAAGAEVENALARNMLGVTEQEAQVEIEANGERNAMVLRSGRSTFTLQCLPPEDYPVMSSGELPHNFTLAATELQTLIDRTM